MYLFIVFKGGDLCVSSPTQIFPCCRSRPLASEGRVGRSTMTPHQSRTRSYCGGVRHRTEPPWFNVFGPFVWFKGFVSWTLRGVGRGVEIASDGLGGPKGRFREGGRADDRRRCGFPPRVRRRGVRDLILRAPGVNPPEVLKVCLSVFFYPGRVFGRSQSSLYVCFGFPCSGSGDRYQSSL